MNIADLRRRIDKVKDSVAIETVIEKIGGVTLANHWSEWSRAICPFHDDHTPSAGINRLAGIFFCHACGIKGDVIDVAKEHLARERTPDAPPVTLTTALEWLEELSR